MLVMFSSQITLISEYLETSLLTYCTVLYIAAAVMQLEMKKKLNCAENWPFVFQLVIIAKIYGS